MDCNLETFLFKLKNKTPMTIEHGLFNNLEEIL